MLSCKQLQCEKEVTAGQSPVITKTYNAINLMLFFLKKHAPALFCHLADLLSPLSSPTFRPPAQSDPSLTLVSPSSLTATRDVHSALMKHFIERKTASSETL